MMLVHAPDFVSFSEMPLLRSLTSAKRRPNLLVACADTALDAVISQLRTLCAPPFHAVTLPGPLTLPTSGEGTLMLHEVAALTLNQQLTLYDWLSAGNQRVQVVSVTRAPLLSFVEDGRFLEGLFYRLNTVCVIATGDSGRWQDRNAPDDSPLRRGGQQ
jgi:transcriptional regulator of acetoin/glycerol metabolism